MLARPSLTLNLLGCLVLFVQAPYARATSSTIQKISTSDSAACSVAGKFLEAVVRDGKIQWRYLRSGKLGAQKSTTDTCEKIPSVFDVWIPGGSFSTLSNSVVYPGHINEPKAGEHFQLRILYAKRPMSGWFFAGPLPRPDERGE